MPLGRPFNLAVLFGLHSLIYCLGSFSSICSNLLSIKSRGSDLCLLSSSVGELGASSILDFQIKFFSVLWTIANSSPCRCPFLSGWQLLYVMSGLCHPASSVSEPEARSLSTCFQGHQILPLLPLPQALPWLLIPGPGWEAPASRSCIVPLVLRFATPFLAHRLVVLRSFL